jgi:hypothetical protein
MFVRGLVVLIAAAAFVVVTLSPPAASCSQMTVTRPGVAVAEVTERYEVRELVPPLELVVDHGFRAEASLTETGTANPSSVR